MASPIEVVRVSDRPRRTRSSDTYPTDADCWHRDDRFDVRSVGPDADSVDLDGVECVVVETGPPTIDPLNVLWTVRKIDPDVPVFAVPLETGAVDGMVFENGSVTVTAAESADRHDARDLADEIVAVVEKTRREKTEALHDVAVDLVTCDTELEVFERAMGAAVDLLDLVHCVIHVLDDGTLDPVVTSTPVSESPISPDHEPTAFDVGEGATGTAFQTGESILVDNTREHEVSEPSHPAVRSAIVVPLGDIGVFVVIADSVGAFDEEDRTLAELLAAHVRTATERIRSSERTRRERDRFLALFENVPDAAAVCDPGDEGDELRIVRVNAAFERTFGVDRNRIEGDRLVDHVRPPAVAGGDADADANAVPETEPPDQFGFGTDQKVVVREMRAAAADGVREFLSREFTVETDDRQRYVILTDITERKRHNRQLEEKTERLEQFASIVSHDLRNPLDVAKGWATHCRETSDNPETVETIDKIETALHRMDALVEDILTLARTGWTVEHREPIEGKDLAVMAWDNVATGDATLVTEWDDTVAVDPNTAVELFENLFRNSVEHGSTGSQTQSDDAIEHASSSVTVTVGSLSDAKGFYLADDGPGVDPEIRESAFEMGVTGDLGSTGIGLAIVERIAHAHDWTVRLTESADGGAWFEFRFEEE